MAEAERLEDVEKDLFTPIAQTSSIDNVNSTSQIEFPVLTSGACADMPPIGEDSAAQPLSKKAQKRLAKAAIYAEKKLERRAREKAAKKEKKREKRERVAAAEISDEDGQPERKKAKKSGPVTSFNARVVVDLAFDDFMYDKEISSLCSQLAYTYSANRKARCPFSSLLFTTLDKRTKRRLQGQNDAGYQRWANTEWWEEGYEQLWAEIKDESGAEGVGAARARSEKDKVVYLTADADDELQELKEGETYIIGGICDHNRYKNLCQKKAVEDGIRSARLPIGKYLADMTTRKVLTVNQVFEILVHWTESRSWEEALYSVVPKRKFQQNTESKSSTPVGKADILDEDVQKGRRDTGSDRVLKEESSADTTP